MPLADDQSFLLCGVCVAKLRPGAEECAECGSGLLTFVHVPKPHGNAKHKSDNGRKKKDKPVSRKKDVKVRPAGAPKLGRPKGSGMLNTGNDCFTGSPVYRECKYCNQACCSKAGCRGFAGNVPR